MTREHEPTQPNERTTDWTGEEWAGEDQGTRAGDPDAGAPAADRWVKTEYAGDHGSGMPEPVDPAAMPEGETSISGNRHAPGEQHWSDPAPGGRGRDESGSAPG